MMILRDMVHILTTWCRYNSVKWNSLEQLLTPKEKELLLAVRNEDSLQDCTKKYPAKYKKSLSSKLCKELTYFPGKLPDLTEYQYNVIECNSLLCSIKLVSTLSIRHTPLDTANRLLLLSRTFDLTNHRMAVLKHLFSYYAEIGGTKYNAYLEEFKHVRNVVSAEDAALYYYNELIVKKKDTKKDQLELHDYALKSLIVLEGYIDNGVTSVQFYIWYYNIKIVAARLVGDYDEAAYYALQGYTYFNELPFRHVQGLQEFLALLAECYLQLRVVDKAREYILALFEIGVNEGSPEWIMSMRLLIRLELSCRNYIDAFAAYTRLTENKLYKALSVPYRITEVIQEQYFNILILMNYIPDTATPSRLIINRFMKNDPEVAYHKKEVRIPLIIAQLLYNIYYKEYDDMMTKLDTLKDYCARRLSSKSPYLRSNIFIRMLLIVPSSHFNAIAAKRNGVSYYKRMTGTSYNVTHQDSSVEIIPYEHLWELVLNHLKGAKRLITP